MAKWLMIVGLLFIVLGALLHYVPWTLNWFGKLPGDIHIKLAKLGASEIRCQRTIVSNIDFESIFK